MRWCRLSAELFGLTNGSSDLWRYIAKDIHIELGATSGTTVSLNDTDVRGLVSISSGAIDLADFYGASAQAFNTTTIGITEGDDTYPSAFTTDIDHTTALESSTLPTGVTISGKSHTLYAAFRRQNASNYSPYQGHQVLDVLHKRQ